MNDTQIIELINKELDGLISDEELRKLNEILETNPDARRLRAEHRKVAEKLATVEPVEPPPDLKAEILKTIEARSYAPVRRSTILDWLRDLGARTRAAHAYSFVAGAVVGVALLLFSFYGTGDHMPLDNNELVGTVMIPADSDDFRTVDRAEFSFAELSGAVTVHRNNGAVFVRADVESVDEIELVLEFDAAAVSFAGFEQSDGAEIGTLSKAGLISVRHRGRNSYTLVFKETVEREASIALRIYSDTLVFSKDLDIN